MIFTVKLDDICLGTRKGKVLLFLHGFSVPPDAHLNYLKLLGQEHKVFAPDLTRYCKPKSIEENVDLVKQYIKQKQIGDNYSTIGYSMGSGIAFKLASVSSCSPRTIISLAPLLPVQYNYLMYLPRAVKLLVNQVKMFDKEELPNKLMILDNFIRVSLTRTKQQIQTMKDLAQYSFKNQYINQPVQMITGTSDEFFHDTNIEHVTKDRFRNIELIKIPQATHDLAQYNRLIASYNRRFLNEH